MNASASSVVRNAAVSYVTTAIGVAVGLVATPVLVSRLGVDGFGAWTLILAVVGYLGLLEAGLGTATITRVARREKDGDEALGRLLTTSLRLHCFVALLAAAVLACVAVVFPDLFNLPDALAGPARLAFLLVGAAQVVAFLSAAYIAGLIGTGRQYVTGLSGVAISTVSSLLTVALLLSGSGLITVAAVALGGGLVSAVVLRIQWRRVKPGVAVRWWGPTDPASRQQLRALGWRNSVIAVCGTLAFSSDAVLVGLLLGPAAAAAYGVAGRGSGLIRVLATKLTDALAPTYALAEDSRDGEFRFGMFRDGITWSWLLAVPLAIATGVFARPLLELWIGDVPSHASTVLSLLCLVLVLQMPGHNSFVLLQGTERVGLMAKVTVAAALLNVTVSVGLTLALGVVGPALGSLVTVLLADAVLLPLLVLRQLGVPSRRYWSQIVRPVLLPTALCLLLALLLAQVVSGWPVLPACGLVFVGYVTCWWFVSASHEQRRRARGVLRRR